MFFGFLDFWIFGLLDCWTFGFLDFWIFGFLGFRVLQLCFQSVETDPTLDSEKGSVCVGIYSVFKGCACRGGVTIHTYTHLYLCVHTYIDISKELEGYIHMYWCVGIECEDINIIWPQLLAKALPRTQCTATRDWDPNK